MDTYSSGMSSECLVTDLVNELSSGLEIPFLLSEDITTVNKQENVSPLDTIFCEESSKEDWTDDTFFNYIDNFDYGFQVKDEVDEDLQMYLGKADIARTHSTNGLSGSGSGSGSECSSTEIWVTKNELDTPPITPPDERISPESLFLLPSDEFKFIPISPDDNLQGDKVKINISNVSRKIRIQPKPISTTLNIFDIQPQNIPTVMCNVFNDINSNSIKNTKNGFLEAKNLFKSNENGKKSVLSKKDLELLQAKRKQERMIRNRESAYLSRKRKKEHVAHLEKQVQDLVTENNQLRLENCSLRQRLAKYEELDSFPVNRKSRNFFTDPPKKTTALLALMLTVCLNIGSLSSLINDRKFNLGSNDLLQENIVPVYSNEMRHTRSLLWTEPEVEGLNLTSFTNLTKSSCPLYINQTESIRLESELRRWIEGDEDYSRPSKRNISKISQYFYTGEKPPRLKNVSKRKNKNRKGGLQMDVYQMKPNLFNFDTFFEAIHRRDDTFYLVSFSGDHLLLPALSHNKTSRPKMSLMLPAFLSNGTGTTSDQVEMMQIDCEVTNTQLLSVNENDIPSHMRPYSNSTSRPKNETESKSSKFEEFFVNDLPEQLLPSKKLNFKPENGDQPETDSNLTFSKKGNNKNNGSKSPGFKMIKFQETSYNLNENNGKTDLEGKELGSSYVFDEHKTDPNKFNKVLSNETYQQDQDAISLITASGKNLLKLLVVGPGISSHTKAIDNNNLTKSLKYNHSINGTSL